MWLLIILEIFVIKFRDFAVSGIYGDIKDCRTIYVVSHV